MKKIPIKEVCFVLWSVLLAFLLLSVCSRSSFLYPCNDWNDANSFLTMGKAMMNGQVLYKDLFEQKGPYLYLIYGLASLISTQSFAGVFVFEILSLAVFLYMAYRIMTLYCSEQITFIVLPILSYAVVVSKSFYWGGAAEEFCIPIMCFSLYCILKHFRNRSDINPLKLSVIFINGILAGVIAQIKYTLLGFYFAWIVIILLECLMQKECKKVLKNGFVFLFGMILASVPWLIYFVANGALKYWYECYIYDNIFLYGNISSKRSLGLMVYDLSKILYYLILDNASYFVPIIIGMIFVLVSKSFRWHDKISVYILFGFTFVGIYIGGANLPYYSLPLTIFSIIGFSAIGSIIDRFVNNFIRSKAVLAVLTCATVLISIFAAYEGSMNTFFIGYDKEDFFLFKFKQIVDEKENPTLLTYNCLDAGLYTVADIMPTCRFYHRCNLDLDEMVQEQDRFIEEGLTDFVLTRDTYPDIIFDKYELVDEEIYEQVGADWQFTYYLFELKSD